MLSHKSKKLGQCLVLMLAGSAILAHAQIRPFIHQVWLEARAVAISYGIIREKPALLINGSDSIEIKHPDHKISFLHIPSHSPQESQDQGLQEDHGNEPREPRRRDHRVSSDESHPKIENIYNIQDVRIIKIEHIGMQDRAIETLVLVSSNDTKYKTSARELILVAPLSDRVRISWLQMLEDSHELEKPNQESPKFGTFMFLLIAPKFSIKLVRTREHSMEFLNMLENHTDNDNDQLAHQYLVRLIDKVRFY